MKYVFGKYDWATLARGEAYCYLMTNGLGGFSSQTIVGSCCRNDQAVLMACTHAPNCRYNVRPWRRSPSWTTPSGATACRG